MRSLHDPLTAPPQLQSAEHLCLSLCSDSRESDAKGLSTSSAGYPHISETSCCDPPKDLDLLFYGSRARYLLEYLYILLSKLLRGERCRYSHYANGLGWY
jgi:hypothetical protein